ncbi:hypothetical protein KUCAC02_025190 [Chaenocephalus aceratus]|nr:hypothetical protein KUCAC02_025190 [Chaenocephalus aceratus]
MPKYCIKRASNTEKIVHAKIQRSLDSSVSSQPRALIGRRRKEAMMMNVNGIDGTPVPGAQDLVDFSPVYRCLHIYTVLVSSSLPTSITLPAPDQHFTRQTSS